MPTPQRLLLFGLVVASACASTTPYVGPLGQAPPREIADSLRVPADATIGPVIPGLAQNAVPQGMTSLPSGNRILTSHYASDGGPSRLALIDWTRGAVEGTFTLVEPSGVTHSGHVGGIAADAGSLWVASDGFLYRGDLDAIEQQPAGGDFPLQQRYATEATEEVAFCSVIDEQIWAGEFALDNTYPTHPAHHMQARDGSLHRAWISAYDPGDNFAHPTRVLSIPDRVQGMAATDDTIVLSVSYGRRKRSSIEVYRNPLSEPPHRIVRTSRGEEVPLWFLDGRNHLRSIDLPPMSQNVIIIDGRLAVLFELGASKFRLFGKQPLDHILLLPIEELR